ncbi:MAG TPA: oxygenase MpaB family protein [Trebonia sp.]|nr:oxygenase MpaB family protein [Trebonia sp.]
MLEPVAVRVQELQRRLGEAIFARVAGPEGPVTRTCCAGCTWPEADSFLRCHQRYGARPLDAAGCDGYLADAARIAVALGVPGPPRTQAELATALGGYRPELRAIPEAIDAARFLVRRPPLPLAARGPYALLAAAAVAELPDWARRELRLPRLPAAEPALVRPAGRAITGAIRWAMSARRQELPGRS